VGSDKAPPGIRFSSAFDTAPWSGLFSGAAAQYKLAMRFRNAAATARYLTSFMSFMFSEYLA